MARRNVPPVPLWEAVPEAVPPDSMEPAQRFRRVLAQLTGSLLLRITPRIGAASRSLPQAAVVLALVLALAVVLAVVLVLAVELVLMETPLPERPQWVRWGG